MTGAALTRLLLGVVAASVLAAGPAWGHPRPSVNLTTAEMQLMCTSCHEPLALAQSPQAQAEKDYVRQLIGQGLTLHQIENRMVAQYGVAVLGKPPAGGFNLIVYILPPVLLALGIGFLVLSLPKWRARSREAGPLPGGKQLDERDAERLNDDLARFI